MIRLLVYLLPVAILGFMLMIAHQRNVLVRESQRAARQIVASKWERERAALRESGLNNFVADLDGTVTHIHVPDPVTDVFGEPLERWVCRECLEECGPAAKLSMPAEVVAALGFVLIVWHANTDYWVLMPDVSDEPVRVERQTLSNGGTGFMFKVESLKKQVGWTGAPKVYVHTGPIPHTRVLPPEDKTVRYQLGSTGTDISYAAPLTVRRPTFDYFKR